MIRVAIFADTVARAQTLAELIAEDGQIEIVSAGTLSNADRYDEMAFIDVILATSPTGLSRFSTDGPPVLAVGDERESARAFRRPIRGWLPSDVSPSELLAAITAAAHNFAVLTADQADQWLQGLSRDDNERPMLEALTLRETQVLRMLADGLGNKEIAAQLGISGHTAKFHVGQILSKMGANSRAEAVALGMRRGLVPV